MYINEVDILSGGKRIDKIVDVYIAPDESLKVQVIDTSFLVLAVSGSAKSLKAPKDLLEYSPFLFYAYNIDDEQMYIVNWAGVAVYKLNIQQVSLQSVVSLDRNASDDTGMYRLSLVSYNNFLFTVYENGVICLASNGDFLWRQDHNGHYDWFFDRVDNNVLWYTSEYQGSWGYKVDDGSRVSLKDSHTF